MSTEVETKQIEDTVLNYLANTYKFEDKGKLVRHGIDAKGVYLILNETIFYPQGGGQPADNGTIKFIHDSNLLFNVQFVGFVNGKVHHYIKEEEKERLKDDLIGKECELKIDKERRLTNAKSHTSGHLIASIVEQLASELIAVKGYHFPDGPYVEFKGKLSSLTSEQLIAKFEAIAKEKIESKTKVKAKEDDTDELLKQKQECDSEFQLQPDKKARLVEIEGGTHLKNLDELKEVKIRKVQTPKGNTKIGYSFA